MEAVSPRVRVSQRSTLFVMRKAGVHVSVAADQERAFQTGAPQSYIARVSAGGPGASRDLTHHLPRRYLAQA